MLNLSLNILLVDDDADDYVLTRDTLREIEGLTFKLEWQSSYETALAALQSKTFDLCLFDYHIGAKSGYDLLLAAKTAGVQAPIIMLTGNGNFEADRQAIQAGAADYLVKSHITVLLLEKSIRHALERNKIMLELAKKTEEAEKLALVASRTENAVVITDARGFTEWVNESFTLLTGYGFAEAKGKKPGTLLQGTGTDPATVSLMSQAIQRGEGFSCEVLNYNKAKQPYWARINAQPIYDEEGKLEQFVAIETDITESRQAQELLREAEAQQRAMLKAMPDLLFVMDKHGNYLRAEAPSHDSFPADPVGKNITDIPFVSPDLAKRTKALIGLALATGQMQGHEYEIVMPKSVGYYEARVVPIDHERVLVLSRNISQRKISELALRESEERYSLAAQGANDGLWDWDIVSGKVYYSPRWKAMLGYGDDEVTDNLNEWLRRVHPEDSDRVQEEIDQHLEGKTPSFESEHRIRHQDGSYRWVLSRAVAVRDTTGQPTRMAGWQTDSSSRVAAYDALTNLPNRKLFTDRLERALNRVKQQAFYQFAVLYIDLDSFKFVNDTLGHAVGDALLVEASQRLERSLRQSDTVARLDMDVALERPRDTVARFGGDEFAILLDGFRDVYDVVMVAERIQEAIAAPFVLGGSEQTVFSTASIGIALSHDRYTNADDMLRDADIAMYRAKHEGKARHALFDSKMHAQVKARFSLESELRTAIEHGQFNVYYQPIVHLATNKIMGFEALVRWQHPKKGIVSPVEFIPLAEETGLVVQLDSFVLSESLKQLRQWHTLDPTLTISVNLSARHFEGNLLVHNIHEALRESGVAPQFLALEVTEGMLSAEDERVQKVLETLRAWGMKIYLDDFGTGYSSLSRLNRLPIDLLKIDKSFIIGTESLKEEAKVIEAILQLATAMQLEVVAEGIEKKEQSPILEHFGCKYGQGYFFAPPLTPWAITEKLRAQQGVVLSLV
ncbi:MAG: EAL domain-containing protein [Trueperaceae bacterium]